MSSSISGYFAMNDLTTSLSPVVIIDSGAAIFKVPLLTF